MKVAFAGLGVMGGPMAGHLAKAGMEVRVYNRTAAKAQAWRAEHGGAAAATPAEAARDCRLALCCVGNDDDVRAVALGGDGLLAGMPAGAVLVDHTTASASLARELHRAAREQGKGFVDAPVSGGEAGARDGTLTVMAGGEERHFAAARPALDCYARYSRLIGPPGSGQLAKMVNQICIAGVVEGLAEGLHFGQRAGLDMAAVVETVLRGAAGSWQMEHRWRTMLDDSYEFGFAVDWMRKDLALALAEAKANGAPLPLAELVDGFYAEVQAMGGGRWDTSSLLRRYARGPRRD